MTSNYYIVSDIGGTQLRAAVFAENGTSPVSQKKIPTSGKEPAIERLKGLIADVWPKDGRVVAIAAAVPGPVDPVRGLLYKAPNIPEWVNLPLKQILEERFKVPTLVGNDANVAALGEWRFGAGQKHHDVLYITISTGIGGGVILNDQLLLGHQGLATELGHMVVMQGGPKCGCGKRGHVEAVCSGTGIARFVIDQLKAGKPSLMTLDPLPTSKEVVEAAQKGDALAIKALSRAGRYMGIALSNFLHAFNPSIIVLGGGVTKAGELMFKPMREEMKRQVISPSYLEGLEIKLAALGDNAGLMGALALAQTIKP
jgi:glucokinase